MFATTLHPEKHFVVSNIVPIYLRNSLKNVEFPIGSILIEILYSKFSRVFLNK